MNVNAVKKVVIAGGGTAGWMAAASLAKLLGKTLDITLIESDQIGTVGVGEATIPTLLTLHRLLHINEQEFMAATNATFKLGIGFENWANKQDNYIHSFGYTGKDCWAAGFQHFWVKGKQMGIASEFGDYCPELIAAKQNKFAHLSKQSLNYAYHLDASLYAKFLQTMAFEHGAKRIEGKISQVNLNEVSGYIDSVTLDSGNTIEGDLFIDCTGFRALLIEQALHTGFDDWSHWLPANSAIAVQTMLDQEPKPYTRAIAHDSGWQWQIPLQTRMGNGIVYCDRFIRDEDAKRTLIENLPSDPITDPRVIKFTTGQRRKHWNKNCVAIGLSSGFIEPLESTSIHLIQRGIVRLMQLFPQAGIQQADVDEFNRQTQEEVDNIRDFIILHYNATERTDSAFWRHCKNLEIPDTLRHRIELFRETGRVFKAGNELFGENSWTQVMMGQGILPKAYHPIVDVMSNDELSQFLNQIKYSVDRTVQQLPNHQDFLKHYCKTHSE
ncbi:tryptophan 7-halogenase [Pseudoalteromonas xiamenensis]|uniref:tryptophan halogenase family protein n=1 Tax=Pseudoalteromonas xiamenensis TaxID=882626 RepID=UPI0027E3E4FA|nr:tryptophan 7-halogenase [Pseudoalteromonas xiamenensis]WMN59997.1 tryptophan 7-halogenase [Pseudoalteromonas xiamenensis]